MANFGTDGKMFSEICPYFFNLAFEISNPAARPITNHPITFLLLRKIKI